MKKTVIILSICCTFILIGAVAEAVAGIAALTTEGHVEYQNTVKQDLLCLFMAYPENIVDIQKRIDDKVYVKMKSGNWLLYDDKKKKSPEEKLSNPDLQDMLEQVYPLEPAAKLMEKDFDPGRARVYALLKEVYGETRADVEANLVSLRVGYNNYLFNRRNGASNSLEHVMKELVQVIEKSPAAGSFVFPAGGTYNYRVVAGTNRLSPHAFGIAIDLASGKGDYWKWASPEEGEKRLESYPKEVVQVFENNGFIWGGKWNHFDILHFEYRPEIILKARCFGNKDRNRKLWYEGVPSEGNKVKDYIYLIERALSMQTL